MPITVSTEAMRPLILDHMADVIDHVTRLIDWGNDQRLSKVKPSETSQ